MRRWDRLVEQYMEEYTARGVCAERVTGVCRELDRLGAWLKHRRPKPKLEEVGSDLVVRYIGDRTAFKAKSTVSNVMSILRGMGDFLVREHVWSKNPLRWLRGPKLSARSRVPRRIDRGSMQSLWESAAAGRQVYHRSLWVTVLSMLYGTGMRRGELERLDMSHWRREEGVVVIDGRKTGRQRQVPVPEMTWRCMEAYLPLRQNHLEQLGIMDEPALLINKSGHRLSGRAISLAIRRIARRCDIEKITLHQFRHTCASDLLAAGLRVPEVQKILGHQTVTTTVRYLHIAGPEAREAVKVHPINEILKSGDSL